MRAGVVSCGDRKDRLGGATGILPVAETPEEWAAYAAVASCGSLIGRLPGATGILPVAETPEEADGDFIS